VTAEGQLLRAITGARCPTSIRSWSASSQPGP
jgi:hypothetical protein